MRRTFRRVVRAVRPGTLHLAGWAIAISALTCSSARAADPEPHDPPPHWIWGATATAGIGAPRKIAEPEMCHFERRFELADPVQFESAELRICCDDRYVLRINDRLIGIGHSWHQIDRYDVGPALRSGENVIHVIARNDDAAAGLLLTLDVRHAQGDCQLVTDRQWQAAVQKAGTWDPRVGLAHDWKPAVELGPWPASAPWGDQPKLAAGLRTLTPKAVPDIGAQLGLEDGDRVVLVGATLIEREPQTGFWETRLMTLFPGRKIVFRNLGWSGDTVSGIARARFGTESDGFEDLEVQVHSLEPTVILVAYGANESFAGPNGVESFSAGLDRLLDALAPTGAELVLVAPIQHENMGDPLPDPSKPNHHRELYRQVIQQTAQREGLRYIDLSQPAEAVDSPGHHWTSNGIHLAPAGYFRTGELLAQQLGCRAETWNLEIDAARHAYDAQGVAINSAQFAPERIEAKLVSRQLPYFLPALSPSAAANPADSSISRYAQHVRVRGLPPGNYQLSIDGVPQRTGPAEAWSAGIDLIAGPDFEQTEELRRQIVRKNELFFHRWRPQNETYLFLFRKHEQGNNAVEIPQFDPLVQAAEETVYQLSRPQEHTWVWARLP